MLLNKKCVYLGISLFSAMILGSVSTQPVKADTTSGSTQSTTTSPTTTATTPITTTTAPTSSTITTAPVSTTTTTGSTTTGTSTTAPVTQPTASTTTTTGTTATVPVTSTSSTGTTGTATTTPVTQPATSTTTTATGTTATAPITSTSSTGTTGTTTTAPVTQPATSTTTTATGTTATTPATSTSSTGTTGTSTTAPVTSTSSTGTTGTSTTAPVTQPATSTTTTSTTTTATGTTTPVTSASSTGTTGTSTTAPVTQPTTSTTTTATGTTAPVTSTTTTTTATTGTITTPVTSVTATSPYALPSNLTDDTVVTFTDPNLEDAVKYALGVPYTSNLTVGDIKSYNAGTIVPVSMSQYDLQHPNGPTSTGTPGASISDEATTPIESLDGMQYLQLLPANDTVDFQAMLASDPDANTDLTPLDNLPLYSLKIGGDLSNPAAKEIDVSQISKLDLSKANELALEGSNEYDGLNQTGLDELAPTINAFANNGQGQHTIELDNASISDFSPLKGTETGGDVFLDVTNNLNDATPVYAVDGQPISFTAPKILDPSGKDVTPSFTYSGSAISPDLSDDNLTHISGDNFTLNNANPADTVLSYGNYGYSSGQYKPDAVVDETLGNTEFELCTTVNQPLIWQAHPTVSINYVDASGSPISINGISGETFDGTTIGSPYDLTSESKIAGYELTSSPALLKGTYTQDPQTINLTYQLIPATSTSSSSSSTSSTSMPSRHTATPRYRERVVLHDVKAGSHLSVIGVRAKTRINGKLFYLLNDGEFIKASDYNTVDSTAMPSYREKVAIHNVKTDSHLSLEGIRGTTTINGGLFYLLNDGEFIKASDYSTVDSTKAGIVITNDTPIKLFDAQGKYINIDLKPDTQWKYDKIVTIDGTEYYQLAPDEFITVDQATAFTRAPANTKITLGVKTTLYNAQGKKLDVTLPARSTWRTDGCAIINGIKMYRVATDEYAQA